MCIAAGIFLVCGAGTLYGGFCGPRTELWCIMVTDRHTCMSLLADCVL